MQDGQHWSSTGGVRMCEGAIWNPGGSGYGSGGNGGIGGMPTVFYSGASDSQNMPMAFHR